MRLNELRTRNSLLCMFEVSSYGTYALTAAAAASDKALACSLFLPPGV